MESWFRESCLFALITYAGNLPTNMLFWQGHLITDLGKYIEALLHIPGSTFYHERESS